jgi:pyrroline-5-carboxylate reductase
MAKIGIIGAGNMGTAIIAGIHRQDSVYVHEIDKARAQRLKKYRIKLCSLPKLVAQSQAIILAVKPQSFDGLLSQLNQCSLDNQLIVSIAAGITTGYIEKRLGKVRVVRTMPNLPAQVKEGLTGICLGKYARPGDLTVTRRIFDSVGKTIVVKENMIDAVTAVSGSGPGYIFLVAECLEKAARHLGLNEITARDLVLQTLKGSVKLLDQSNEDAVVLRQRVTSKGGTTQAAMDVFAKRGLEKIFVEALKAAKKRARELSK